MEQLFITGAAGFLGTALLHRLATENYSICALQREQKLLVEGVEILKGGLEDIFKLTNSVGKVDTVVHFAATTKTDGSFASNKRMIETNVTGTLNAYLLAKQNKAKRFIYASTAAVYGNSVKSLFDENAKTNPKSLYGLTKLIGENICESFSKPDEIITVLRFSNIYGPGQGYGNLVPDTIKKALLGDFVVSSPDAVRDFIYVDDAIDAMVCALKHDTPGTLNIASGQGYSVRDVATAIAKLAGRKVTFKPNEHTIDYCVLNPHKATKLLGWRATTSLSKGLQRAWHYYEERAL